MTLLKPVALPALAAALAFAANWPQFRGPEAAGVGDGDPPTEWNGESGRNIRWKTAIPGLGFSSPVLWGDRIFLTSAVPASGGASLKLGLYGDIKPVENEPAQSFNVYALDRRTGKILWTRTATQGVPKIKRHTKSTHANPTIATDGKHVAALFGSEGLYVYNPDGKLLWKKDLGLLDAGYFQVPSAQWGYSSSPVIADGVLFVLADVQKDSFLAAFDVRTGAQLWRTPRSDVPTFGTPSVLPYTGPGATRQVVVNGWKQIAGYDFKTGRQLWTLAGDGDIPVPTPVHAGGLVIITNAHGPGRPIYAIRTDAQGDLKESPAIAWKHGRAGNYMQTPLLSAGIGYFCFDNGVLSAYQLSTGERLYQQRLGAGNSGFSSSPVAAANRLYITSEDGQTFVLEQGPQFKQLAVNELGEQVMATAAISESVLYLRGTRHLYAIAAPARR